MSIKPGGRNEGAKVPAGYGHEWDHVQVDTNDDPASYYTLPDLTKNATVVKRGYNDNEKQ